MPYTPPSHNSPANSAASTPNASRRSSVNSNDRPTLPRSTSYLNRARRSPSLSTLSPTTGSEAYSISSASPANESLRQSPVPRTDPQASIPRGALMSPPLSDSDDDDGLEIRGRNLDKYEKLKASVKKMPIHQNLFLPHVGLHTSDDSLHHTASTSDMDRFDPSVSGRTGHHQRSMTLPSLSTSQSTDSLAIASEEESDSAVSRKPPMIRKRSGEYVRPALRGTSSSRPRPLSMPGTPTLKSVHFDSHLEHVRHFLQVDRPLDVSAGSSPVDSDDESQGTRSTSRAVEEWDIITTNFPTDTPSRRRQPVRMERVSMLSDQRILQGSVVVANLAFEKRVSCRFTLDYWKTTSEVVATWAGKVDDSPLPCGQDRFNFSIQLSDFNHLGDKTLFFCVRYTVDEQEYWDNNFGMNFQVDFRRRDMGRSKSHGRLSTPAGPPSIALPRSSRRGRSGSLTGSPTDMASSGSSALPKSRSSKNKSTDGVDGKSPNTPSSLDDDLVQIRFKKPTSSTSSLEIEVPTKDPSSPNSRGFSTRYDFSASLTAAKQSPKKPVKQVTPVRQAIAPPPVSSMTSSATFPGSAPSGLLQSSSYEDLVAKYCFYGTKPNHGASPTLSETRNKSFPPNGASSQSSATSAASIRSPTSPTQQQTFRQASSQPIKTQTRGKPHNQEESQKLVAAPTNKQYTPPSNWSSTVLSGSEPLSPPMSPLQHVGKKTTILTGFGDGNIGLGLFGQMQDQDLPFVPLTSVFEASASVSSSMSSRLSATELSDFSSADYSSTCSSSTVSPTSPTSSSSSSTPTSSPPGLNIQISKTKSMTSDRVSSSLPNSAITTPKSLRSASPVAMVENLPLAGTSSTDLQFQSMCDRFSFMTHDSHSATAIRG